MPTVSPLLSSHPFSSLILPFLVSCSCSRFCFYLERAPISSVPISFRARCNRSCSIRPNIRVRKCVRERTFVYSYVFLHIDNFNEFNVRECFDKVISPTPRGSDRNALLRVFVMHILYIFST